MEIGKTPGSGGTESRRAEETSGYTSAANGGESGSGAASAQNFGELSAAAPRRGPAPAILSTWVAVDPASLRVLAQAQVLAGAASAVLIRGESGTGKNLLAQLIHYLGPRSDEPLITVDCATLPPEMTERELFGSDQDGGKRGRLEMAEGGTLVLDEVAALPMPVQARLLRVIDEKRFERLGGARSIAAPARVVALTTVDLERAVARRTFREDLYFRLNVAPLLLPPLRERPGDVAPMAERFAQQLAEVHRKPRMTFSPAAVAVLETYSYPGNVRELRDIVERAVAYGAAPELLLQDLPPHLRDTAPSGKKKMSLEELERQYIAEVLDYTRGKKTMAAHILGISRKTLLEKRKRYGLE